MESLENKPIFSLETKTKEGYLKQIAGNMEEKSSFLVQELQARRLPEIDGRIRILDCGVGGGELVGYLDEEHKDPFVDIIALDIVHEYIERIINNNQSKIHGVVGNAFEPPFKSDSLSAINLSSILHEIISYGPHDEKKGRFLIIQKLFSGLSKCLASHGIFTYRDIYLPENHNEVKSAVYSSHFATFVSVYGAQIIKNTRNVFETELPVVSYQKDFCEISGNIHYHRELQRHFITFTDFLCNNVEDTSLKDLMATGGAFGDIESLFARGFLQERLLDDWNKREGFEAYTYASVNEIQEILAEVSRENNFILEVEQVLLPERIEYSNFIGQYTDFIIPDKKQMMLIRKQ